MRKIKKHQGVMRYFKNTSWLFLEKVLKIVSELFIGIWIARYLGPEHFGLLSYSQSFAGLFMVIATLGLNAIIVRELVKDESKRDLLLGTSFILQLLGALLVLVLLLVGVSFTSNDSFTNALIFIIAFSTIFKSFNVIDLYFQSKVLSRFAVYANMILLLIASIVKISLILNEASLIYFSYVLLFESLVLAIGFIFFYTKNNISIFNWKFDKILAISLLKDSWPLILSGIVITVYMKIDQVMIKDMLGNDAVGQYAAAVKLSEAWYFIPTIIVSSLFPAIINAKKQSKVLYYERVQKLYKLLIWLSIAIAIPMTYLSDFVVSLLYREQYAQAGGVLMIHIWAGIFVFFGVARGKWIITENMQRYGLVCTAIGAIANVLLNYILIDEYGIIGAAYSTLISYCISSIVVSLFYYKDRVSVVMFFRAFNLLKI